MTESQLYHWHQNNREIMPLINKPLIIHENIKNSKKKNNKLHSWSIIITRNNSSRNWKTKAIGKMFEPFCAAQYAFAFLSHLVAFGLPFFFSSSSCETQSHSSFSNQNPKLKTYINKLLLKAQNQSYPPAPKKRRNPKFIHWGNKCLSFTELLWQTKRVIVEAVKE